MTLRLETTDGPETAADRERVAALLSGGRFFWLDLHRPGPEELGMLGELFGFHPLAIEDSEQFGQRPKVELYDDVAFVVAYGAPDGEDDLVEVHCFLAERNLVTVHRDRCGALDRVRCNLAPGGEDEHAVTGLHRVLDALTDSLFPRLDALDERTERLADDIVESPADVHLRELLAVKRQVVGLRQRVGAQRDAIGRIVDGTVALPGVTSEGQRYFRDVEDHLLLLDERIDAQRDIIIGTANLYLSSSSNRLNEVMKRLTIVATIFLPLTFVTGFFGQNFGWMVDRVGSLAAFLVLGVGGTLVSAGLVLAWLRARHVR